MTFIENRSSILSPYQRYVVYIYIYVDVFDTYKLSKITFDRCHFKLRNTYNYSTVCTWLS